MKRILTVLAVVPLLAQEHETVFTTGTRLVQVDVVVQTKDKIVKGLTKDDFELLDNGKPQAIAILAERHLAPLNSPPRKVPPGTVMNRPIQDGTEPVSATAILIDAQNTNIEDQGYARVQALKYIDSATRRESIAVYQLDSKLTVLQSFTEDRDALHRAFDRTLMRQSFNLGDVGATGNSACELLRMTQQRRADITTGAFRTLARQLKDIPGRKKLLWITSALPLTISCETSHVGATQHEYVDMSEQILGPVTQLNNANVAVYPIDPRGLTTTSGGTLDPNGGLLDPNLTTMIRFAERTGGKALYNTNDVAGSIESAIADTDVTYTLGFYPHDEKYDGKEHSLRVKLKNAKAELRYRSSYIDEAKPTPLPPATRDSTVDAWMQETIDATFIPLIARAAAVPQRPGYVEVTVSVDPSALKLEHSKGRYNGSFQLAIAPDVEGKTQGSRQTIAVHLKDETYAKAVETGIIFVNTILANPQIKTNKNSPLPKRMHIVVLDDATGNTGSVHVPISTTP